MEIGTLKKLRTVVPGTLIMLGGIPLYILFTLEDVGLLDGYNWAIAGGGFVMAYVIGAIYNLYGLRAIVNGASHQRITTNIKERLLAIGRTKQLSETRRNELLSGTELMDIFYSLIDSHDSLKERAKLVRDNGLVWSSIADFVVVGACFAALYLPIGLVFGVRQLLVWGVGAGVIAVVCFFFLHPRAEERHIALGNEQLNFIDTNLRERAQSLVDSL